MPNLTAGQIFARDMRKNLGIGTRTRVRRNGINLHEDILECIQHALYEDGWYTEKRAAIFSTARGAWLSFDKHIAGHRVDANMIFHISQLSPWQFCNLLGEMVDANITNVGEGERFLAEMARKLHALAA